MNLWSAASCVSAARVLCLLVVAMPIFYAAARAATEEGNEWLSEVPIHSLPVLVMGHHHDEHDKVPRKLHPPSPAFPPSSPSPASPSDWLRERRKKGPVFARKAAAPRKDGVHEHLFVISWPYTGSTALLGLLSSSPEVSTLCGAGTFACEGHELLVKANLIPKNTWVYLKNPDYPADWNEALRVYSHTWNMSKAVLVAKDPPNYFKVAKIAHNLARTGKRVVFLLLTMSPFSQPAGKHLARGNPQTLIDAFRSAPTDQMHHIRYEDLIRDPYGEAQRILDFLPSLRSLDPAVSKLEGKHFGSQRDKSIVDYVLRLGGKPLVARKPEEVELSEWREYLQIFGYI